MNDIKRLTLDNGIKVVFDKRQGAQIAAIRVLTTAGALCEKKGQAGRAHLANSLMQKSTKTRNQDKLSCDIEDIGASLSTTTEHDFAAVSIDTMSEYFKEAIEILADIIKRPAFKKEELVRQKEIAIAGLKLRADDLETVGEDAFNEVFYKNTPYAYPHLGRERDIKKQTVSDIIDYHRMAFDASNLVISVSGNIDENTVMGRLNEHFADIPKTKELEFSASDIPLFDDTESEEDIRALASRFNQAYILEAFPCDSLLSPDYIALRVLATMLGGKMTSVFFIRLREELGLAYMVASIYPQKLLKSFFGVHIGLDKKNVDLALDEINIIFKNFIDAPVNEKQLSDAKTYLKGLHLMARRTAANRALAFGLKEIMGQGFEYDLAFDQKIDEVNAQHIAKCAERIFTQRPFALVLN